MSLDIKKEYCEEKNKWVITPIGEVDIYTSPKFKEFLSELIIEKESDLLIDGIKLDYIDSTGLGVLISALKKLKEKNKNIYISNVKPNIRKLFDITSLDKVFIIEEWIGYGKRFN